ncbi:hypothetical protein ACFLTH_10250 [Bacteroidota bacterium]
MKLIILKFGEIKKVVYIIIAMVIVFNGITIYSQGRSMDYSFWNFKSLKGSVGLEGNYFYKSTGLSSGFYEKQTSYELNGLISFLANSFIIHPRFISLDIDGLFRLGARDDNYIVTPSETSITTTDKLILKISVFNGLPINGGIFCNYNHSYIKREYFSNIENKSIRLGTQFNYQNTFIPFTIGYDYNDWHQKEIELDRSYRTKKHNLRSQFYQSSGKFLTNKLLINYSDFDRTYSTSENVYSSRNLNADLSSRIQINGMVPLDYFSLIVYNRQEGFAGRKKIQVLQNLNAELPYNFRFLLNYNFHTLDNYNIFSVKHSFNTGINHQLFKSLKSFANYEYSIYKQNTFNESANKFQIGLNYSKKIPSGSINLMYNYGRYSEEQESKNPFHISTDEEHILDDNVITLLDNPGVVINTIIVTDANNIITYQKDYDYEIIERGDFTEIRRMFGGQISNGANVLIDYQFFRNDSFSYNSSNHAYSLRISLFDNLLEAGYSGNELSYDNVENIQILTLKEISEKIYSVKMNYRGLSIGYEYNIFQSNIVPYKSYKIFGLFNYIFYNTIVLSLNSNFRKMIMEAGNEEFEFWDIIGMMTYSISMNSKLVFEGSRQLQKGRNMDLELYKFKTEYQVSYRSIQIHAGLEFYRHTYIDDKINYFNGYIKIKRNF